MCPRLHNKDFFYKYTKAETAKRILENRTIRWSSPLCFNDPFDCSCAFDYGFEFADAKEPFINELVKIVFGKQHIRGDMGHRLYQQLILLRPHRQKANKREFRHDMAAIFSNVQKDIQRLAQEIEPGWKAFMQSHRILCLSETNDNILMWSHYADFHKGAVFRLRWVEELDNTLGAAIKVRYSDRMPAIIQDIDDFVKYQTGQIKMNYDDIYTRFVRTKSTQWAYEQEWRIVDPRERDDGNPYTDKVIIPNEIESIYLGCQISENDKDEILQLIHGDFSHVQVFQGKQSRRHYSLSFERIN